MNDHRVRQKLIGEVDGARGLVGSIRPPENARIVLIDVTPKGANLADELMQIAMHFEDTLISNLDKDQVNLLKTLLCQINQQVEKL
jgi:DNA-binding MarR family transcriptional regulator